jgi:hypothetical protein
LSARKLLYVACDGLLSTGLDCHRVGPAAGTLAEARREAGADGWLVNQASPDGQDPRDLCPVHRWEDRDPTHRADDV